MPRLPAPISDVYPYHVTARCLNREWFDLPLATVWSIMEDYLYFMVIAFDLRIHSFVLMPNHFHLIVSTPKANLSQAMQYLMRETSREITRLTGRVNQTYGARHHKSLITSTHYYMNAYKYVYRNPVRASFCERAEEYRYSTLSALCGCHRLAIPLVTDTLLFTPSFDESTLRWLNASPEEDEEDEIRKALRRPKFELKADKNSKRPSLLEIKLI